MSQNAAPAVRRKAAPARKKHNPVSAVAEPVIASAAVPEIPVQEPAPAEYRPDREEIAALAYSYWVARGYQGGSPDEDWLRAERELSCAVQAASA